MDNLTPQQRYYRRNREAILAKQRAKNQEPEEKAKKQAYRDANKSRQKEYNQKYYEENRERLIAASNQYYADNTEDVKKRIYDRYRDRIASDPIFKMVCYMRSRVRNAIYNQFASKTCSTFDLVGCEPKDLKKHLEDQFREGMTWDNYGEWHVDHIRPCDSFNLSFDSERKECFHFSNLQPLWANENLTKGNRYE